MIMTNLADGYSINRVILVAAFLALTFTSSISCGSATTVEANEAVDQSCSAMEAVTDLDVTTYMKSHDPEESPTTINAVFDVEVSGDNWRAVVTFEDDDDPFSEP